MVTRPYVTLVSVLFALSLISCATFRPIVTDSYIKPGVDFSKYTRLAVVGFTDAPDAPGSGKEIADIVGLEMLKKGYNVYERNQVELILQEQKMGLTGFLTPETASEVGKVLGVKAIISGTVGVYHREKIQRGPAEIALPELPKITIPGGEHLKYEVSLTIKMIDVETSTVLWFASGSLSGKQTSAALAKEVVEKCLKTIPLQKATK